MSNNNATNSSTYTAERADTANVTFINVREYENKQRNIENKAILNQTVEQESPENIKMSTFSNSGQI